LAGIALSSQYDIFVSTEFVVTEFAVTEFASLFGQYSLKWFHLPLRFFHLPNRRKVRAMSDKQETGADFSPCRKYRYRLWRTWDASLPKLVFCMLNPSTADEIENDPTITRCQRRAIRLGFGSVEVVNLFAWRSTTPDDLYQVDDPIGPDNDKAILQAARGAKMLICGWGGHDSATQTVDGQSRAGSVRQLLRKAGATPYVLGLTQTGAPKHSLYIAYEVQPVVWEQE
jgi:hypothetical protein